ncbi:DUF6164 family protein [Thiothrix winogradskyi]|uniref:DUF6164 family protein n=1 Tax=Thiothrix winogradskyi TaxID=96472 RepID=A0ABY3T281_9GAMM|nr:DUF6164 family protein [Thiothrix winogradskyi]UJS24885.1 DUF6164 family protein [Thiothrix winogradskyi]
MAVKLMSFRDVTDEEAEEICALLHTHRFEYYETPSGNWGISAPILWLYESDDLPAAQQLLAKYQQERSQRIQAEYELRQQRGEQRQFLDEIREYPVRVVALLSLAAVVAYFSIAPFLEMSP